MPTIEATAATETHARQILAPFRFQRLLVGMHRYDEGIAELGRTIWTNLAYNAAWFRFTLDTTIEEQFRVLDEHLSQAQIDGKLGDPAVAGSNRQYLTLTWARMLRDLMSSRPELHGELEAALNLAFKSVGITHQYSWAGWRLRISHPHDAMGDCVFIERKTTYNAWLVSRWSQSMGVEQRTGSAIYTVEEAAWQGVAQYARSNYEAMLRTGHYERKHYESMLRSEDSP